MAEFHSQSLTATAQLLHERGTQLILFGLISSKWGSHSYSSLTCTLTSAGSIRLLLFLDVLRLLPEFLTISCCALSLSPNSCYPDNSLNPLMYLKNNFIEVKVTSRKINYFILNNSVAFSKYILKCCTTITSI